MEAHNESDALIMYANEDGEKVYRIIPGGMSSAVAMADTHETDAKAAKMPLKPTGITVVVAGYNCKEYLIEEDDSELYLYLTEDLNLDWKSSYGGIRKKFARTSFSSSYEDINGILLKSISKESDGSTTVWETYEVDSKGMKIKNSDYKKIPFGM